jgi:hypothetical protein
MSLSAPQNYLTQYTFELLPRDPNPTRLLAISYLGNTVSVLGKRTPMSPPDLFGVPSVA